MPRERTPSQVGAGKRVSTLGYETVELLRGAELRFAAASLLANGVLGVGAVLVGRATVKILGI